VTEYEKLLGSLDVGIDYHEFLGFLCELEDKGIITLYAGTYSLNAAMKMDDIKQASFYFYYNENKTGFCFCINPMGASVRKDDDLFSFSHRRLYSRNYLSNCFFGEPDFRCGEYFKKKMFPFLRKNYTSFC